MKHIIKVILATIVYAGIFYALDVDAGELSLIQLTGVGIMAAALSFILHW